MWQPAHSATGPSSVRILQNQDDTDRLCFNWPRSPSLPLSPSRFLSSSLPAWHFSGRSSNEKFLPSWSRHSRSQPPCLGKVEWLGLGGMMLPPGWSQAMAKTPAHNTFLQLLTSPPSNQERGEERKDRGLVVVCFILSAGLLHGHNTGPNVHEMPAGSNVYSSILHCGCSDRLNSSQSILSDQFLCIFSTKTQYNEKSPQWFTDAQQGKSDVSQHGDRLHSPPQRSNGVHITVCQSKVAPGQLK